MNGSDFACLPHAQPARMPESQSSTAVESSDYQRAQEGFFIARYIFEKEIPLDVLRKEKGSRIRKEMCRAFRSSPHHGLL